MARIVITSAGTGGDFVPFVALGKALRTRGQDVLMAINPAMLPLARDAGVEAVPCGRPFGAAEARERSFVFDHWQDIPTEECRTQWELCDLRGNYLALDAACRHADLLVASSLQSAAPMVHEKRGIPWVSVSVLPAEFPHVGEVPPPPLAGSARRAWQELYDYLNTIRAELGFGPLDLDAKTNRPLPRRLLLASSRHFSQPDLERRPEVQLTGFWFDDAVAQTWEPDVALADFLAAGPPPLVLTLSSLPVADAGRVAGVHVEAAAQCGQRLLVQRGWAELDWPPAGPGAAAVFVTGHVPHAWLFPRAAAIIHHGGIGTTAQSLRFGRPALVEPYGNDQFFNARRVLALGAGAAMHPHKLTATGLARALAEIVLTPECYRRAAAVGAALRTEDGLKVARTLIEQELRQGC